MAQFGGLCEQMPNMKMRQSEGLCEQNAQYEKLRQSNGLCAQMFNIEIRQVECTCEQVFNMKI